MKRIYSFMLGMLLLVSYQCIAQTQQGNAPVFQFVGGELHDFGTVAEGPELTYVFQYKNVGKTPLVVRGATAACNCTSATFSKAPVLPGQMGTITVKYTTNGHPGAFYKDIYIQSNAATPPNMERYELHIKGTVKAK